MTTLFQLAEFYQERDGARGNFQPAQVYLEQAARRAIEGYASLEEAEEEAGTRYDGWGNEIEPTVIYDAVRAVRAYDTGKAIA